MSTEDDTRPYKRTRSSVACNRCKDRRQKCDNASPSCTKCQRAGVECVYKGGDHPAWYVESLENRIKQLESGLGLAASQSIPRHPQLHSGSHGDSIALLGRSLPSSIDSTQLWSHEGFEAFTQDRNQGQTHNQPFDLSTVTAPATPAATLPSIVEPTPFTRISPEPVCNPPPPPRTNWAPLPVSTKTFPPSHLGDALGFLSLCAAAEPYYVGASTGFSLANLVQAAVYDRLNDPQTDVLSPTGSSVPTDSPHESSRSIRNLPSSNDRPFSCHRPGPTTKPAELPSEELGNSLLRAYLVKVHTQYPFLDREKLWAAHQARDRLAGGAGPTTREARLSLARLHLVYGIGARHLQLSGRSAHSFEKALPEAHFIAATEHLNAAFELRTTENIEILLLLAFYSLHSPSGPGAWHLTGMAVRLCVELGLHRRTKGLNESKRYADQMRKRLFWSALILERKIAVTLGRPFSLADYEIDVEVPADVPDDSFAASSNTSTGLAPTSLSTHVHLATLQPIIAAVQACHRQDFSRQKLINARNQLTNWRNQVQSQITDTPPSLLLEYHKVLHLLLQPLITATNRQPDDIKDCAAAAGEICQLYKLIHQREPAGFYLLEMHDVLVAGITLIYCLWTEHPNIDTNAIVIDLGSCSTVLFLIAERWESAKRYRDAFEVLVRATLDHKRKKTVVQPMTFGQTENNISTAVRVGSESRALFDPTLWGDDDDTQWRRMLSEMTGTNEPSTIDDSWLWLNDTGLNFSI